MDFSPVPPGTLPAVALAMRGADPDLVVAAGDSFVTTLTADASINIRDGAAPNEKLFLYSEVAGLLTNFLFTRDAAVLDATAHGAAVIAQPHIALMNAQCNTSTTHNDQSNGTKPTNEGLAHHTYRLGHAHTDHTINT